MEHDQLIKERTSKALSFFKNYSALTIYVALAAVVAIAVYIRTRSVYGLLDITTGGWTLGPDLDPFLFLRWAKYIVANGHLMAIDTLRYVPLGFDTNAETILLPYMIAWFHYVAQFFGSTSVDQSAALFPVFMFALTVVSFFLFVREIFTKNLGRKNAAVAAVIASLFLSVIPALLPRTIAGIPEKESAGFFFLFLALYFFVLAWNNEKKYWSYAYSLFAGIVTMCMSMVWGGHIYIFLIISVSTLLAFIAGQVDKKRLISYSVWILSASFLMAALSERYSLMSIISSTTTGIAVFTLLVLLVNLVIFNKKYALKMPKFVEKMPPALSSIVITLILAVIASSIIFDPSFIISKVNSLINVLIKPTGDRIGVTVAENSQPYFNEWAPNFGPIVARVPILLWMFIIGAVCMFYNLVLHFDKKERLMLTGGYVALILSMIFTRYSSNSAFNGEGFLSFIVYLIGIVWFLGVTGLYLYRHYTSGRTDKFANIDYGLVMASLFLIFGIISARGAVRLIMVLVPPAAIMSSYLLVFVFSKMQKTESDSDKRRMYIGIVIFLAVLMAFSAYAFYGYSVSTAQQYVPSVYTQQWQKAMSWVRENTPQNAVFAHWWDYGYWVQSIGERATILDGGNAIGYWNHLIARTVLTSSDTNLAHEFLYSHNATHLLIDSSDIGKYTAFSSIGSNVDYDRRSWISTFVRDSSKTEQRKNSTIYVYTGNFALDEDISYVYNGTRIFFPGLGNRDTNKINQNIAGVGAIIVEMTNESIAQPEALLFYKNQQMAIPLRYMYTDRLIDFGSGLEAGIVFIPRVEERSGQVFIDANGAIIYLSNRTVNTLFAKLYLYNDRTIGFTPVHVEDDYIVDTLKSQNVRGIDHFVYYNGVRGPITIWEIDYSPNVRYNPSFVETEAPAYLGSA